MSFNLPALRLIRPAASAVAAPRRPRLPTLAILEQVRTVKTVPIDRKNSKKNVPVEDELKTSEGRKKLKILEPTVEGSIYDTDIKEAEAEKKDDDRTEVQRQQEAMSNKPTAETSSLMTDPDPRARMRWERKMVMQMIKKDGRTTKAERIRQSEREYTLASSAMHTGIKKLGMLARQIAGKTLDEAVVQMQFSKKKFSEPVREHLEAARAMATAEKGMGLGEANGEAPLAKPLAVMTKDGRRLSVSDPTKMYIDQAWVGKKKKYSRRLIRMGRGRRARGWLQTSALTVLLKEEKTRIRQHNDRRLKEIMAKPWVQLPNKPISGQRPYYSW